jgi:fructose-1,6-bisphosphatase
LHSEPLVFMSKYRNKVTTLGQFIIERQEDFPYAKGELSRLLRDIGIAAKIVNREVNKAGLVDILGEFGTTNVQGEDVKKLDVFANEQFISALKSGGECCAVASEENENMVVIDGDGYLRADMTITDYSKNFSTHFMCSFMIFQPFT